MKSLPAFLTVLFGSVVVCGLIIACITWFHLRDVSATYGVLFAFTTIGIAGLVFMGLHRETATRKPMAWKRAILYSLSAAVAVFGILTFFFLLLGHKDPVAAFGTLIPFAVPSIGFIAYLMLTEQNRRKPEFIETTVRG
jgi:peptidoglycan/LPS O-acetylase OafA/YrhL